MKHIRKKYLGIIMSIITLENTPTEESRVINGVLSDQHKLIIQEYAEKLQIPILLFSVIQVFFLFFRIAITCLQVHWNNNHNNQTQTKQKRKKKNLEVILSHYKKRCLLYRIVNIIGALTNIWYIIILWTVVKILKVDIIGMDDISLFVIRWSIKLYWIFIAIQIAYSFITILSTALVILDELLEELNLLDELDEYAIKSSDEFKAYGTKVQSSCDEFKLLHGGLLLLDKLLNESLDEYDNTELKELLIYHESSLDELLLLDKSSDKYKAKLFDILKDEIELLKELPVKLQAIYIQEVTKSYQKYHKRLQLEETEEVRIDEIYKIVFVFFSLLLLIFIHIEIGMISWIKNTGNIFLLLIEQELLYDEKNGPSPEEFFQRKIDILLKILITQ